MTTSYSEINMFVEQLSAAWGSVAIDCAAGRCVVSRPLGENVVPVSFEAPTLLRALRLAAYAVEEGRV